MSITYWASNISPIQVEGLLSYCNFIGNITIDIQDTETLYLFIEDKVTCFCIDPLIECILLCAKH